MKLGLLLLALGLLPTSAPRAQNGGYERALQLLGQADYRGALDALEGEPDLVRRRDGLAELYYRASDPAAALVEAEAGLALEPAHLNLLFRACASALWLGSGARAERHAERLTRAVEEDPGLSTADRELWRSAARDYAAAAREALAAEALRAKRVTRAKRVAFGGLAVALVVFALTLFVPLRRGAPRSAPQGTSSKPS